MYKKHFTLVELLVIIAVISVLVSLLLPQLSQVRDASRAVQCSTNLKAIYGGAIFYAAQNNNSSPPDGKVTIINSDGVKMYAHSGVEHTVYPHTNGPCSTSGCREAKAPLAQLMGSLVSNEPIVKPVMPQGYYTWYAASNVPKTMFCPDHAKFSRKRPSKVAEDCYLEGDWNLASYAFGLTNGENFSKVAGAGRKVYAVDSPKAAGYAPMTTKSPIVWPGNYIPGSANQNNGLGLSLDSSSSYNFFTPAWFTRDYSDINDAVKGRHGLTTNLLFFDGHVEKVPAVQAARAYQGFDGTDNNMFFPLKP